MRNKIIIIGLVLLILFVVLIGLRGRKGDTSNNNSNTNNSSNEEINKSLVLYFSATGTTKSIAERIASKSNSDIIEIIPKDRYSSDDLDYNNDCRANREQNDDFSRPEIENDIDITKYNIIYLGYPIWWGTNPKIILTLLDTYDFTNKTIIPFCTSGSSSIDNSVNNLRNYNSKLNIKNGKRFSINDSDKIIEEFIKGN